MVDEVLVETQKTTENETSFVAGNIYQITDM